jgi:hypothetical protein
MDVYRDYYVPLYAIVYDIKLVSISSDPLYTTLTADLHIIRLTTTIYNIKEYVYNIPLRRLCEVIKDKSDNVTFLAHMPYTIQNVHPRNTFFPDELIYVMRLIDAEDRLLHRENSLSSLNIKTNINTEELYDIYVIHPRYFEAKLKLIWYMIYMGCNQLAMTIRYNVNVPMRIMDDIFYTYKATEAEELPNITRAEEGWLRLTTNGDTSLTCIELLHEQLSKILKMSKSNDDHLLLPEFSNISLYEIDRLIEYKPKAERRYNFNAARDSEMYDNNTIIIYAGVVRLCDIDHCIMMDDFMFDMGKYISHINKSHVEDMLYC